MINLKTTHITDIKEYGYYKIQSETGIKIMQVFRLKDYRKCTVCE